LFVNVLSQQPDDKLHKHHSKRTQITKDNKKDTSETNTKTTNRIILKKLNKVKD
jgi:hypothetical protein